MSTPLRPEIIRTFHEKQFSAPVIGIPGRTSGGDPQVVDDVDHARCPGGTLPGGVAGG
jgi:hypothetical protein